MIDLRSDTVTLPTAQMYQAIQDAPLGDDVYDDDPTTKALEAKICQLLGHQSALFVTSGVQANLCALLSHCGRGDAYITGDKYHIYYYESGGGASLAGLQPQLVPVEDDGSLALDNVLAMITGGDVHFANTKLLCLENTHHGIAIAANKMQQSCQFAKKHALKIHLDGARIFNAAAKLKCSAKELAGGFDSVSVCLSKGLGAPAGSLLCGSEDFIARAKRWRKALGGGMRQSGILAACGLVALDNLERLENDHKKTQYLAQKLTLIQQLRVDYHPNQTNMIYCYLQQPTTQLVGFLLSKGIKISQNDKTVRLVVHQDIREEDLDKVYKGFKTFFETFV